MEWRADPVVPNRERGWEDGQWTKQVRNHTGEYVEPYIGDHPRWQYGVINIGAFKALDRLTEALSTVGERGWELVTIYDKASNWMGGIENGFILLKRPVPPGQHAPDGEWCISVVM